MHQQRRNRHLHIVVVVAAVAILITAFADAASVSINPAADTFVPKVHADSNYGHAGALEISGASAVSNGQAQSLLRFDLSSVKSSFDGTFGANKWTVQSVVLQLTCATPNNAIFNSPNTSGQISFSLMNGANANSWLEGSGTPMNNNSATDGSVTFNNLSTYLDSGSDQSLGTFGYTAANSGNVIFSFNLPAALNSEITSGGMANVRIFTPDTAETSLFESQNFQSDASQHPLLTVTAVPEPGCISIAAGALVLLLNRRRKHV